MYAIIVMLLGLSSNYNVVSTDVFTYYTTYETYEECISNKINIEATYATPQTVVIASCVTTS